MKKIYYLFLTALCALFATSCSEDGYVFEEAPVTVSITSSDVVFPADASTGFINFTADGTVTATSDKDWCTISQTGNSIQVSVTANPNLEGRMAMVTLTCGKGSTTAVVQQKGWVFNFQDATFLDLSWKGTEVCFPGKSTFECTLTPDVEWITTEPYSEGKFVFTLAPNDTPDERIGTVKVTANGMDCTVTLIQSGWKFAMEEGEYEIGVDGGKLVLDGTSECAPSFQTEADWLTPSWEKGKVSVNVQENPEPVERTAELVIFAGTERVKVTITQSASEVEPEFSFAGTYDVTYYTDNAETKQATGTVTVTVDPEDDLVLYVSGLIPGKDYTMKFTLDEEMDKFRCPNVYYLGMDGSNYVNVALSYTSLDGKSNYYGTSTSPNYDIILDYEIDENNKAHFSIYESAHLFNKEREVRGFYFYEFTGQPASSSNKVGSLKLFRHPVFVQQ